jgi:glycosyltransferase involved in cell wall biosynthesis
VRPQTTGQRALRICLVASSRFPVGEPFMGGLEAHTHALASALVARGHEVCLFAAAGSDPSLGVVELPVAEFTTSAGARSDVGAMPEQWMAEHHAYLDLLLAVTRGDHGTFDVVHNNSLHHLPIAMSPILPAPVVTTLHTPPLAWLESAASFADAGARYVAVSRHTAQAWEHVVDAEVIHNGIDTTVWTQGPGGGGAMWSGRLVPEKAPHEALAAARIAGLPLDLAGPVHDRAYFDREVLPLLDGERRYVGHLGPRELRTALGGASVAVVTPAWEEPFGLVAAEALACGTPVAAYDRGALGEIVTGDCGRLAPGGDVEALAAAMLEARALSRDAARARAESCFDHARMVDGYERTYRSMSQLGRAA